MRLLIQETWKVRQVLKKHLLKFSCTILLACLLPCSVALATTWTYPGNAVAPQEMNTGDTFTITSGTFESTGTSITDLGSIQVNSGSSGNTITISGGSISATGTSTSGATVPIYGVTTSGTTVAISAGGSIAANSGQSSTVAMDFTGPVTLTNSGTITGNVIASAGSSVTNSGSITAGLNLGSSSTVINNSGGTIAGGIIVGNASTITLFGNNPNITGGITSTSSTLIFSGLSSSYVAPAATGLANLTFENGSVFNNASNPTYAIANQLTINNGCTVLLDTAFTGAGATSNAGTLFLLVGSALPTGAFINTSTGILSVDASNILPTGSINSGTIAVITPYILSTPNSYTFTLSSPGTIGGSGTYSNAGTMNYSGASGSLTVSNLINTGSINITSIFNPSGTFTNTGGSLYVGTGGSIGTNVTAGSLINYGQLSSGATSSGTFAVGSTISNVANLTVSTGSILNIATGSISGATIFTNNGTTNFSAGTFTPSTIVNTGALNIAAAFTVPGTITNTGVIYFVTGASLVGTNPIPSSGSGGTISIGQNSSGTSLPLVLNATGNIIVNSINIYAGASASSLAGGAHTITANLYLVGTSASFSPAFSGSAVSGSMLTTGIDSFGTLYSSTAFTASAPISSFPTINVEAGTFTTSGSNTITGVNNSLNIASGATLSLGASISGTGTSGINSGTLNISAGTFGLSAFNNNLGGVMTFSGTPTNTTAINNYATGTGFGIIIATGASLINSATINNYGLITYNGAVTGGGTIINNSGGTIKFSTGASNANAITNNVGGTITVAHNTLGAGAITNYGTMTIGANFAAPITNESGGSLALSAGTVSNTITNDFGGTFTVTGTTAALTAAIFNYGTMLLNGELTNSGGGSITNENGGTLTLSSGTFSSAIVTPGITNDATGILNVSGTSTNNGAILNYGTMTVSAQLGGNGTITNETSGTLTLAAGTNLANAITNISGGNMFITGAISSSATITNQGSLTIGGNITMTTAATLTSSGSNSSVTVSGQHTLNTFAATSYTNSHIHNTTITSSSVYDQLVTSGSINLTGATVNVTTSLIDTGGSALSFVILSSSTGAGLTAPTTVSTPASTFDRIITTQINPSNITITINAEVVAPGINTTIANVLQNMFASNHITSVVTPTNSGPQQLYNAFYSPNRQLNYSLHELLPISNAVIFGAMQMPNLVFHKVETRIASIRDDWSKIGKNGGINAGDFSTGTSMWISASGSVTAQGPNNEDDGYNAKTGVFLLGRDMAVYNDVVGLAGGYSLSHIEELSNANFIDNVYRYHALLYGSHNFKCNNYLDWFFTGSFNNNVASRAINISGTNFSTQADYKGYQAAFKFIRGKGFEWWESYMFTPFTFLQYAFLHQNAYKESGSAAALSVEVMNKNVATLGLGTKFNFPLDAWQSIGMRELRATVVYDFINTNNATTASFVVGSQSFQVISSPARWGIELGAGIAFDFANHFICELDYDFEWRNNFTDNTLLAKIKYVF